MTFNVDSYLEYFLTLLGWIINNGLFGLLVSTGLFIAPLIGVLIKTWLEVKKQGADEGNKGELLIDWLGIQFFPAMLVIVITLAPMLPISLNNMAYNVEQSKHCGYKVPLAPEKTGYANMVSEFADKQAKVPLLWGLMHAVNKGILHGAVSTIPCKPDLRQIRFEVQHEKINNPALLTEVRQFVQQCYLPARRKVLDSQVAMNAAQAREVSWLGGKILVNNSELYPRYRAMQPMQRWAYDPNRDQGLPNTGEGGFPHCDEWWADSGIGLKDMLLSDMRQNLSVKLGELFTDANIQDEALLRTLLRPENINISRGKAYEGYGGSLDSTLTNNVSSVVSALGITAGSLAAYPGFDAMRNALPMIQALLIMAVIILTPIVIIFSGYSLKAIVTLMFVQFALVTVSFWWELARWLDSFLISILYNSPGHQSEISWAFLQNSRDDVIMSFVLGVMFLVLPGVWVTAMSWAGVNLGRLADSFHKGSEQVQKSGSSGPKLLPGGSKLK
ncbi:TPA: conjugal transfer protein TraG N-terminal domain-containing protein [Pasteurella multocida]|uniref:conjugal transfer protein TraG N-terminal domain-containing protein n=1 Tax=Pasteurella multocida TaxID=747 RepID=UPI001093889A|nr:conjugal transfer protein TraG N-terminal domain-containing protein [Pasteurella multocida]NAT88804.1 conjugal transfer protein TraG [Pasteurella multocida]QCA34431.1 conjugal transfer protein TraG [Pasteurella multocida]QCA35447.1 conjugal transfer protein TraG [Pasteurella multocida]QCA40371.1 conjugal transfer protein TraG [Pasteurella multocida]HDX0985187.1 conjugal transfer protein TraG N-terminal domain-containing protein [Pasteurella multocida]